MHEGTSRNLLIRPLRDFLATESAGGLVVVLAAFSAVAWANSPWRASYERLWATMFELRLGPWSLALDLRHWVNEALMAISAIRLAGVQRLVYLSVHDVGSAPWLPHFGSKIAAEAAKRE